MINGVYFSFDDEPVNKFCYDISNKKIEIYFAGYYDERLADSFVEGTCAFVIEQWSDAKSKVGDDIKYTYLDKHMGIFSLILYMELKGNNLEILVNTIDDRYITLLFVEPKLSLKQIS